MSEIKIYDPTGKCKHCMGGGHVYETVCLLNRWGYPNSMDTHVLISHCPYCNGTGKPDEGEALADKAMQRREQGSTEGVKMDLHELSVQLAREMWFANIDKHVSFVTCQDGTDIGFKEGGKIVKVTVEWVDEDEACEDADKVKAYVSIM